jgi:voltage-gated potassium channel
VVVFLRLLKKHFHRIRTPLAVLCTVIFVVMSGWLMHWIEPDRFVDPFTGMWYVMTTVTTVGYGDYAPSTVLGRLFGMFLFVFGIAVVGVVIGKLLDAMLHLQRRKEEGRMNFSGEGHIVMIGYGTKASHAIDELLLSHDHLHIVLIDTLERTPRTDPRVHYVRGDPADAQTLHRANVTRARSVIIFGDDRLQDAALIDGKSLLIAAAIERIGIHIFTVVELMREVHRSSFAHVQVDEFVLSHETISHLAVRSALSKTASTVFSQLLSSKYGDDVHDVHPHPQWHTYGDAVQSLLAFGAILIADRGQLGVARKLDAPLPRDALLTVICDDASYKKLLHFLGKKEVVR